MLDIPEPSMLELRMQTCAGLSEPLSHYEIMSVDSLISIEPVHAHCMHAQTPCPPSGSPHGKHLKEGTCLKCSVIIGRKVGLDYMLVCLFAPDQARRTIFVCTLIAGRKSRERERDCTVFAHESFVLAWFLRISKHNVWVSQSILLQLLPMRTQNPNLSCASAFIR